MSGLISPPNTQYTLLYFFASWHASHSQLSAVFKSLPALVPNKNCTFRTVEAETNTEESEKVRARGQDRSEMRRDEMRVFGDEMVRIGFTKKSSKPLLQLSNNPPPSLLLFSSHL
jgi:hypothetical protein